MSEVDGSVTQIATAYTTHALYSKTSKDLCVFVDFLGLGIAIPILPYLAIELGGLAFDVGALGGVFSVGQLIGNFVRPFVRRL